MDGRGGTMGRGCRDKASIAGWWLSYRVEGYASTTYAHTDTRCYTGTSCVAFRRCESSPAQATSVVEWLAAWPAAARSAKITARSL
jgi:hypothetical protein